MFLRLSFIISECVFYLFVFSSVSFGFPLSFSIFFVHVHPSLKQTYFFFIFVSLSCLPITHIFSQFDFSFLFCFCFICFLLYFPFHHVCLSLTRGGESCICESYLHDLPFVLFLRLSVLLSVRLSVCLKFLSHHNLHDLASIHLWCPFAQRVSSKTRTNRKKSQNRKKEKTFSRRKIQTSNYWKSKYSLNFSMEKMLHQKRYLVDR